jgi:rhamnogalacturonyl hydrolase YesR
VLAIDFGLRPQDLATPIQRMWQASAAKIRSIDDSYSPERGTPVFTVRGRYTARGWTEWTQGFQFGSAILQFDATGERAFLDMGRDRTVALMAPHVTHVGVHDHGFNNISTYGNLLRLMAEGRIDSCPGDRRFHEMALKASAAVQASRWTPTAGGGGFIYSFNGPHSLFVDTMRSLRSLAVGHRLGHALMGENDRRVSLLGRLVQHATATATHGIWYGEGRDQYDIRGRTAHECVFNTNDGNFRCPSSQQGYSPFSTWTRGLAWAMCGFAEQLEFLRTLEGEDVSDTERVFRRAAEATCDFYIDNTPTDGVPYWDTGAPELRRLGDYLGRPAEPFNDWEPVDSSAAAIAAQGLMRLGRYLGSDRYFQAGLTTLRTLLGEPYLSLDDSHQGLLLHSVYHRPNGWDHVPEGRRVPCGESSMWGDYHLREAALYVQRVAEEGPYLVFWAA